MNISATISKFNESISEVEFIDYIIELDELDKNLKESSEIRLRIFYNNLYSKYSRYINKNKNNTTKLKNNNETIGHFMDCLSKK